MGRRHYRVRHRPRIGQRQRGGAPPRPVAARQEPQPVLTWAALRKVQPLPLAALVLRWLLVAVLCLTVLDIARVAGVPIVLIVLTVTWAAAVRGHRRSRHQGGPTVHGEASPVPPAAAAAPPRGNPYDLETYLKRLGEDGR